MAAGRARVDFLLTFPCLSLPVFGMYSGSSGGASCLAIFGGAPCDVAVALTSFCEPVGFCTREAVSEVEGLPRACRVLILADFPLRPELPSALLAFLLGTSLDVNVLRLTEDSGAS